MGTCLFSPGKSALGFSSQVICDEGFWRNDRHTFVTTRRDRGLAWRGQAQSAPPCRSRDCQSRAVRRQADGLFAMGAGACAPMRRRRRCRFCRRLPRRPAAGHSDLDQGPVRGVRLCDLCRLAEAAAGEIRNRRSGRCRAAPAIGERDGQDPYGRIRVRRRRAKMPITAARTIPGTPRRIAHPGAHRAAPACRCAKARLCWLSAAIPRPRCACPRQ